jgi:hypothetical protein
MNLKIWKYEKLIFIQLCLHLGYLMEVGLRLKRLLEILEHHVAESPSR